MAITGQGGENRPVKIDLLNPDASALARFEKLNEKVKLDPTKDAYALPAPPPEGVYLLRFHMGSDGASVKEQTDRQGMSTGVQYVSVALECRVVAPNTEWDDVPVFASVTTALGRGKRNSTCNTLTGLLGGKPLSEATDFEQATALAKVLLNGPTLKCRLGWEGYSKTDGITVFSSMDSFPVVNGERQHVVNYRTSKGGTDEVRAQVRIKEFGVTDETAKPSTHAPVAAAFAGGGGVVPAGAPAGAAFDD
jgi:hypothetical protein